MNSRHNKRGFLRTGLCAAILPLLAIPAACGSNSSGQGSQGAQRIRVQVYGGTTVSYLDYVAQHQGFFKKNGLDVDLVNIESSPGGMSALAGGSIDILTASPENVIAAIGKGVPIKLFSGQTNSIWVLAASNQVKTPSSFPQSIAALKGKTFGVTALGSNGQFLTEALLKAAGLTPQDVTFVATGGPQPTVAALESNKIQATLMYDPTPTVAVDSGKAHVVVDLRKGKVGPTYLKGEYVGSWAKPAFVKNNPKTITNFRRALCQTDAWIHDPQNYTRAKGLMRALVGNAVPKNGFDTFTKNNLAMATAAYSKESLAGWIKFDKTFGLIKSAFPVGQIYAKGTPGNEAACKQLAGQ